MTVKWGVIGAGGIASRRTIPEGLLPSPQCELVALMDVDPGRAAAAAQRFGVRQWFTRAEDLLALPEVEAVYIATPNCYHKEQTVAAARAGKHVLVEKPMALSERDAEEMVTACRRAGVQLMVAYMMRFHAHHQRLKAMIEAGELGQVTFGRAQLTCWYPPIPDAWRQDARLSGGGAFIDMGTHCLDLLEMLIGKVKRLSAFAGTLAFDYPVEDTATVLLEFESGAQGVVDASFCVPDEASQNVLEVRGTRGAVVADHTIGQEAGGTMTAVTLGQVGGYDAQQARSAAPAARPIEVEPVNTYRAEVEYFVECIEQDREPFSGGAEAIRFVALTEAIYRAARTGQVLSV